MSSLAFKTTFGENLSIDSAAVDGLQKAMKGKVLTPASAHYNEARMVWNGMIDRKPGLIARCANSSDVVHAVNFARKHGLLAAIRGGGHHIGGNAVCDGGIVIDLSQMNSVKVDVERNRIRVGPGATLADIDAETKKYNLVLPTGINSTTGIAGLTLGGGFGWITRKFGLTIDSLLTADVVTANGEAIRASKNEHPDLFWALRGGGGNFGVVTSFEFQLHHMSAEVLAGLVVHPLEEAEKLFAEYRRIVMTLPDELTCWVVMRQAPPLPFLPEEWHGKGIFVLAMVYCGEIAKGEKATAELRGLGAPIADIVGPMPFADWQQALDPLLTPGERNYWKSHDFTELSDKAFDTILASVRQLPDPQAEVFIGHISGAAGRVKLEATAFPQRNDHFVMNMHSRWSDPGKDAACIAWARNLFNEMAPYAAGTAYINFMPGDEASRVVAAYGQNYKRLQEVKRTYDPNNLFCHNQNIVPAK